jgi:hypothetical protein
MSVATEMNNGLMPAPETPPTEVFSEVARTLFDLEATLLDMDQALIGEDYDATLAGFGATLAGEEERIAAAALARTQSITGRKRIL